MKAQTCSILKVVCGWCQKYMGEKDGKGQSGISHGICDECFPRVNVRE